MLTNDDVKVIKEIVNEVIKKAVAPLVTKDEAKKIATKDDLQQTEKRLTKAIKKEHKIGGEILHVAQDENRKISIRVERIEHHLGFAPVS